MNEYAPLHVEYLQSIVDDPDAPPGRRGLARHILAFGAPPPRYALPKPATRPELIAAVMMTKAHLKAIDLGVWLGDCLADVLYWTKEPEARALRLARPGDHLGDRWAIEIAEAMVQVGRAAAQRLGRASDMDAALHKLEMSPCPACGRAFGADL